MEKLIISTFLAILSSMSFGIIANVPKRALLGNAVTGGLSWILYYLINELTRSIVISNMAAAIIIGVVGLLFAQKLKLPVSTIYVGSLISLVPGGMAFTSITMIHDNNITVVLSYVFNTLLVAISLAVGLGVANQINKYLLKIIKSS